MKDGIIFLFFWMYALVLFHQDDNIARWIGGFAREVVTSFNGG